MAFLEKIKYGYHAFKKALYLYSVLEAPEFESRRIEGEILRNTHSIEKGLSLGNIRKGFGYNKIKEAFCLIDTYKKISDIPNEEIVEMFLDSVWEYLQYHKEISYSNEHIREIESLYNASAFNWKQNASKMGGYITIHKELFTEQEKEIMAKAFHRRHSVREFDGTAVDLQTVQKAVELAVHCPSACNRQCYRVHIVDRKDITVFDGWLDGTGGFADDVDKFLVITGVISLYRKNEEMQYVVTASVFAGYLTIALEVEGVGCCFIQREVLPNDKWVQISKKLGISQDEQIVCILGIGNMKDTYKVPVSHRIDIKKILINHSEAQQ